MSKIGGNTACTLRNMSNYTTNTIGEKIASEVDYITLYGFLDLVNGDSKHSSYNAKIQESDYVFICDYVEIGKNDTEFRAVIDGKEFDVTLIDNPMGLNKHLEIFLRYIGE